MKGIRLFFSVVGFMVGLTGCISPPSPVSSPTPAETPQYYLEQSRNPQTGEIEKIDLALKAAELYADQSDQTHLEPLLNQIPAQSFTLSQSVRYQLLLAKLALLLNEPVRVQTLLNDLSEVELLPVGLQVKRQELIAQADEMLGQTLESIQVRLDLALLLSDPSAEKQNRDAIWRLIQTLPSDTLSDLQQNAAQPILAGWAALALTMQSDKDFPEKLQADLADWRAAYPHHPAQAILRNSAKKKKVEKPAADPKASRQIALLLPLEGAFKAQANSVWKGFLWAYYQTPVENRPSLLVYDTSQAPVADLAQQAVSEGANFIVGPLLKEEVEKVLNLNLPVPVLALNYTSSVSKSAFYELGLSLKDDLGQIIERLQQDNKHKILFLAESDPTNHAFAEEFKQKFSASGGTIQAEVWVDEVTDFNQAIASALQIKKSPGAKSRKDLVRRQDVEAVVMNLSPAHARDAVPALQYYYAGDLPIYATSLIYSGKPAPTQNYDLNGVLFVDLPAVLTPPTGEASLRNMDYPKLAAIGVDAYQLIVELPRLANFSESSYEGATGKLSLEHQQFLRRLSWAKFVRGKAVPESNG